MKPEIMNKITRTLGKAELMLKKYSPEILVVAGVAGMVTSAVMACKATTKVQEVLEDTKEQVDQIHEVLANPDISEEKYSEEDSKKDLAIIYVQSGVKLLKLYGPAIILGVASITAILASNNIMRKRNVALAAAYTAVDSGFKNYRENVIERFGEELDHELKYNIKARELTTTTIDPETGEEKTETQIVNAVDTDSVSKYSEYARFFDDGNIGWMKDPEHNLAFLRMQQNYANELLQKKGYLFLSDVYESLGMPISKASRVVGWVYDPKHPADNNYVDFGIYDLHSEGARAFVNGREKSILLDFNVQGNILDMI